MSIATARRGLFLVAVLVLAACAGAGTTRAMPIRSPAGAAEDLRLVASFVGSAHPDVYRRETAAAFQQRTEALAATLANDASTGELELGHAITQLLAPLHDAHPAVTLPMFQPGAPGAHSFFPLNVRVIGDTIVVDGDSGVIAHGTEIVAIDGRPAAEILAALRDLAFTDADAAGPRNVVVDHEFRKLFHLRFGVRASYVLDLRAEGNVRSVTVDGVDLQTLRAADATRRSQPRWTERQSPSELLPTLSWPRARAARLILPSFGLADEGAFVGAVDQAFAQLHDADALIVDLRGNQGGYRTLGAHVLNHLVTRAYQQWDWFGARVREIPASAAAYVAPAFGTSLDALRSLPEALRDGWHRVDGDPLASRMHPTEPHFAGRVLALIDGLTNSAAVETMAALLHERPDTVVLGEETVGGCAEHVGEIPVILTTPNFGANVLVSLAHIDHVDVRGCTAGRGVVPDVPVSATVQDVLAGRDPVLDEAVRRAIP